MSSAREAAKLVATVLASVGATLAIEHLALPSAAAAQQAALQGTAPELMVYASPRRDTDRSESFIFWDRRTGDFWVYRNEEFKEHFRVGQLGQDMQRLPR